MLKNLNDKNIVLIGFMGTGKSSSAKKLGQILNYPVISTDEAIIAQQNRSIEQIFEEEGEKHFRTLERDLIKKISASKKTIVDCGGGIVINPENISDLKKNGVVIFLEASAESIYAVIKKQNQRPLLKVADPLAKIKELLSSRLSLYKDAADITIDADHKTIDQIVDAILGALKK